MASGDILVGRFAGLARLPAGEFVGAPAGMSFVALKRGNFLTPSPFRNAKPRFCFAQLPTLRRMIASNVRRSTARRVLLILRQ